MKVFLIVIASIAAAILLLLFSSVRLTIFYDDGIRVKVRYLLFSRVLYPAHKKKIKLSSFSYSKTHGAKKKKAVSTTSNPPKKEEAKSNAAENASILLAVLKRTYEKILGRFKIKLAKIHITVASDDAAKTAIMYGAVSQSIAYAAEILDNFVYVKRTGRGDIAVNADFLSEKTKYDIKIILYSKIWQILDILFGLAYNYLKEKSKIKRAGSPAVTEDMK